MSIADDFPKKPNETDIEWFSRVLKDEKFLKAQGVRVMQKSWEMGLPVWQADAKGIYNLHNDGTKEYIKLY